MAKSESCKRVRLAKGNMYPWVTHVYTPVGGECPHRCPYCYVGAMARRWPESEMARRYEGAVRLLDGADEVQYGSGNTVFVGHLCDLFAVGVPDAIIERVLGRCRCFEGNTWVFQTRNTERLCAFARLLPQPVVCGTTIETDAPGVGRAPVPADRARGLARLRNLLPDGSKTFVTVEPMLECDVYGLTELIVEAAPDWVNVGCDSKGTGFCARHGASGKRVAQLVEKLCSAGLEVRVKGNVEKYEN